NRLSGGRRERQRERSEAAVPFWKAGNCYDVWGVENLPLWREKDNRTAIQTLLPALGGVYLLHRDNAIGVALSLPSLGVSSLDLGHQKPWWPFFFNSLAGVTIPSPTWLRRLKRASRVLSGSSEEAVPTRFIALHYWHTRPAVPAMLVNRVTEGPDHSAA